MAFIYSPVKRVQEKVHPDSKRSAAALAECSLPGFEMMMEIEKGRFGVQALPPCLGTTTANPHLLLQVMGKISWASSLLGAAVGQQHILSSAKPWK